MSAFRPTTKQECMLALRERRAERKRVAEILTLMAAASRMMNNGERGTALDQAALLIGQMEEDPALLALARAKGLKNINDVFREKRTRR